MTIATRSVTTSWVGALESGTGTFVDSSSGVLDGQEVTWGSRTAAPAGKSSPEELLAAAHSSCFSMALSLVLGQNQTPPERIEVDAEVALEEVDGVPTITSSKIAVRGTVPGLDAATFSSLVGDAAKLCPVSRLFSSATITVSSQLN